MASPVKLKSLKPSLREHKRYIYLRGDFTKGDVEKAILEFIGILGYAKASPMWISDKVLAINREMINEIRASMVMSHRKIEIVRVSGTLKKLREKSGNK